MHLCPQKAEPPGPQKAPGLNRQKHLFASNSHLLDFDFLLAVPRLCSDLCTGALNGNHYPCMTAYHSSQKSRIHVLEYPDPNCRVRWRCRCSSHGDFVGQARARGLGASKSCLSPSQEHISTHRRFSIHLRKEGYLFQQIVEKKKLQVGENCGGMPLTSTLVS
jgi:hypothetical protein